MIIILNRHHKPLLIPRELRNVKYVGAKQRTVLIANSNKNNIFELNLKKKKN